MALDEEEEEGFAPDEEEEEGFAPEDEEAAARGSDGMRLNGRMERVLRRPRATRIRTRTESRPR